MIKLLRDLKKLPLFEVTDKKWGMGKCRSFHVRWYVDVQGGYSIEFAEKKTFDRWANSANFKIHMDYTKGYYRTDIVAAHKWMEKVCRSGLFDFSSFIQTINASFIGGSVLNK